MKKLILIFLLFILFLTSSYGVGIDDSLQFLSNLDEVKFIENVPLGVEFDLDKSKIPINVNTINSNPYNLEGNNINIFEKILFLDKNSLPIYETIKLAIGQKMMKAMFI